MEFEIVVTKTAETDFDEAISYIGVSLASYGNEVERRNRNNCRP